jgi:hypothetical protein
MMNGIAVRLSARPGGSPHALCGHRIRTFVLLLAVLLIGCSACASDSPARPRIVILLLPGASIDDLSRPDLPHLSGVVRQSAGAWVAAWKQSDLSSQPGVRLRIPLVRDPKRPFGIRADGTAIDRLAREALRKTDLLWIDPGDLRRAEEYAPLCMPAKAGEHRTAALRAADELLEGLLRYPEIHDLWVLAPPLTNGPGLAPFFRMHPGGEPGLLRSGSTHMSGVITGADLAATLAGIAGRAYTGSGYPVAAAPLPESAKEAGAQFAGTRSPLELLRRLGALAERTDRLRAVANYLIEWLLLLLIGAGAMALRTDRRLPRPLALTPLLLPALLLLDGAERAGETLPAAGMLLLIVVGLVAAYALRRPQGHSGPGQRLWSAWSLLPLSLRQLAAAGWWSASRRTAAPRRREPGSDAAAASCLGKAVASSTHSKAAGSRTEWLWQKQRDWTALAATTVAACAVAVLMGDIFRWALLGNSIRLGVRFYGVGNEFMGWWIGAAVLAAGIPVEKRARPAAIGLLLGVALLIGLPALGGKVGGVITALAAVAVEAWPVLRRRHSHVAIALGIAVAALLGLAAWDASRPPGSQTHLGRLAVHVLAEGPGPFFLIARGKLLTNLRLTLGLWGALLAAGVWLIWEAHRRAPEAEATRAVTRLLPVAGVAYLCNDSGVIAAALMLSYGVLAAGRSSASGHRHLTLPEPASAPGES